MRKLMWLLPAMTLGAPALQAQFGQRYDPRLGGSFVGGPHIPGIDGRRDPFGPRIPAVPTMPGVYDPLAGLRPPFAPVGRMPGMPPTLQDILKRPDIGNPILRRRFDPLSDLDPLDPHNLIDGLIGGRDMSLPIPGVRVDSMLPPVDLSSIRSFQFDPKVFEYSKPLSRLRDLEANGLTKHGGGGPPAWLRWEYAAGIFTLAAVVGLLNSLRKRRISES